MGLDIYKHRIIEPKGDENSLVNDEDVMYVEKELLHLYPRWVRDKIVTRKVTEYDWESTLAEYNKRNNTSIKYEDLEWLSTLYNDDVIHTFGFKDNDSKEKIVFKESECIFKDNDCLCFYYDPEELFYQRKGLVNFYDKIWLKPNDEGNRDLTDFGKISMAFDKKTLKQFIPEEVGHWEELLKGFKEGKEFVYFSW